MVSLPLQPVSQNVFEQKFALKDPEGNVIETLEETYKRIAKALAEPEKEQKEYWEKQFLYALQNGAVPAGRIASNAGASHVKPNTSLINCVVSGNIEDSISGIYDKVKESAISLSRGSGIGYCFSSIRPRGAYINGVGAKTSGAVSYMDSFNVMCDTIESAGGRRGAQMGTLHIWHPEILDFVKAKRENGKLRQFNLSVLVTDAFMEALEKGEDWKLYFPIHKKEYKRRQVNESELLHIKDFPFESEDYILSERDGEKYILCKIYASIPAKELWDTIMQSTYDFAEPGVLFIDRINKYNPLSCVETIVATNPCGEQPLPPYGACLLGSIDLTKFVENPLTANASFNFTRFSEVCRIFARMLDNVVELNGLALPEQQDEIFSKRRHGMGYMGLGSALALMKIPYGSPSAVEYTRQITKTLSWANFIEGISLAKEKGCAPIFKSSAVRDSYYKSPFIQKLVNEDRTNYFREYGIRYSHFGSIAPTGTIALTFGNNVSNGIEPSFDLEYLRNIIKPGKATKEQVTVYSYEALVWRKLYGDAPYPDYFVTANDVDPLQHVDMQAAAQEFIDSSISKTINVATDYPFEKFKNIYAYAYKKGLKGCTTFRFNPEAFSGVLVKKEDLEQTMYSFVLESGKTMTVNGMEDVLYKGEVHKASNLFDALKENTFGKF